MCRLGFVGESLKLCVRLCSVTQSCLTLCDPIDCSPPGSSVHGILQARILEWVPCPSPGDFPDPGIEPKSPALQVDSLPSEPPGKRNSPQIHGYLVCTRPSATCQGMQRPTRHSPTLAGLLTLQKRSEEFIYHTLAVEGSQNYKIYTDTKEDYRRG